MIMRFSVPGSLGSVNNVCIFVTFVNFCYFVRMTLQINSSMSVIIFFLHNVKSEKKVHVEKLNMSMVVIFGNRYIYQL